ncbi:Pyridoxamine 5'-phosphate oxidase [uncultured archaeon]|nr:Pyridoxamine 5'-phosphate oxidase [uncultured archaeon]
MADLSRYKDFIEKGVLYLATSGPKGRPNLVCVMGCRLVAKDTICATDNMMGKTRKNIARNSSVAVVCGKGTEWYQLKGTAKQHRKGKWMGFVSKLPINKGADPHAAVLIKIREVYDLWEGKRLA